MCQQQVLVPVPVLVPAGTIIPYHTRYQCTGSGTSTTLEVVTYLQLKGLIKAYPPQYDIIMTLLVLSCKYTTYLRTW